MDGPAILDRVVELDGARLRYRVHPAAPNAVSQPDLVLLHPWFGCPAFWDDTVDALSDRTCYVPELYSVGDGEWSRYRGPHGLAAAVTAMLDVEHLNEFVLAGNSMGGIAAQVLAADQPDRITKLMLIGTGASTGGLSPSYRAAIDAWLPGDPDGSRAAAFVRRLLASDPPPDRMRAYVAAVQTANRDYIAATLATALDLDLRPRLPEITAQTLIVRGELDAGRTPEHVRDLLAGISGSTAVEIAAGGHSPMVDSFDVFITIMRAFLEA